MLWDYHGSYLIWLKVWMEDFRSLLRIRASSHHSKCAICVRHRLIIKRLPQGPGRLAQLAQYKAHLSRQYRDRQVYWGHRAKSRSQATSGVEVNHISMIVDGMDQQKHSYPKSQSMASKEYASWNRPRLASTTLITHGHAVLMGLSPQNVPTSGSRTMELVAYVMTKPLNYIHWPNVFLHLEADNCSKELKHQTSWGWWELWWQLSASGDVNFHISRVVILMRTSMPILLYVLHTLTDFRTCGA